jgi:aspartate/methionine/tyrosine aminotransferase
MKLAERMSRLGTESAFEVLARAKALEAKGKDVVHLEIGEPDFDTPDNIREAAAKAIWDGYTHYCPAQGIPDLRDAIAEVDSKRKRLDVKPEQVVVTPGAKPIMFFGMLALVNEGDEVIYPNPGFPIYESVIDFIGARAVPIQLHESKGFSLDVDELKSKIGSKTKMMIINSPQNPTGGVIPKSDLETIAKFAVENDFWVLTDEVYSEMVYEGQHNSIAEFPGMRERTIIIDGYSKTYAMTGWRLGYGVMPEPLAQALTQLQINATSCTCTFTQVAGIEGIKGDQSAARAMVAEFKKRRDVIVDGLNAIDGITCLLPKGAFYVFPKITGTGMKSQQLSDILLDEGGVAVLPGTAFGSFGEGYLRLSYANSVENIEKALRSIKNIVAGLKK